MPPKAKRTAASRATVSEPGSDTPQRNLRNLRGRSTPAATVDSSPSATASAARQRSLPPVDNGQNLSYGATGRPVMQDNRLAEPDDSLAGALAAGRADDLPATSPSERAASRAQNVPAARSANSVSGRSNILRSTAPPVTPAGLAVVQEEDEEESGPRRRQQSITELATSVEYHGPIRNPRAMMPPPLPRQPVSSEPPTPARHSPAPAEPVDAAPPPSRHSSARSEAAQSAASAASTTTEQIAEIIEENAKFVRSLIGFSIMILLWMCVEHFLPDFGISQTLHNLVDSISMQADIARNASVHGTIYDANLYDRINRLEQDVSGLHMQWSQLQDRLPENLVLTLDDASGEYVVPGEFYSALLSQLRHEAEFKSDMNAAWLNFLSNNAARVDSLVTTSAAATMQNWTDNGIIVSQAAFTSALEEQSAELLRKVGKQQASHFEDLDRRIAHKASEVATAAASEVASHRPSASINRFIEDLTLLNLAQQMEIRRQRNYLNINVGAAVAYTHISPTYYVQQPGILANMMTWIPWPKVGWPNPPEMALRPWTEAGECWCTTPKPEDEHVGQFAAVVPLRVRPRAVVIEHVPKIGTWDIGAAPKEFEVWGLRTKAQWYAPTHREARCKTRPPKRLLGQHWVCLGSATYDADGANEVQKFPLHAPEWYSYMDPPAPKFTDPLTFDGFIVRALSNHGSEWTCFYRVRILGDNEEEIKAEYGW